MWREVVPALDDHLEAIDNGALVLEVLKILAELVPHAGNVEDIANKITVIYDKLLVRVQSNCYGTLGMIERVVVLSED